MKLRPLAVHYDNGFDSDTSVSNILKICEKLGVELEYNKANPEPHQHGIKRSHVPIGRSILLNFR